MVDLFISREGIEMVDWLVKSDTFIGTPIVGLTRQYDPALYRDAVVAGCVGCVHQSMSLRALVVALSDFSRGVDCGASENG